MSDGPTLHAGIYEYKGNHYLLIGLCRRHDTGEEMIAYVPLRTDPKWSGTARIALRTVEDFISRFTWAGARLG